MSDASHIDRRDPATDRLGSDDGFPRVGEWYWVREDCDEHISYDEKDRWLGCVTQSGSNFAELRGVGYRRRVHFDRWSERCTPAPEAQEFIAEQVRQRQERVRSLMGQVRDLAAQLAITPMGALPAGGETQALVRHTGGQPVEEYKAALIRAKKETLPKLFEDIRVENDALASWMKAGLIPLMAQADGLKSVMGRIEGRIFNVELYAGLIEEVEQIAEGKPAAVGERVRLIQHRAYMDEECLAQYKTGGMEFKNLRAFDRWMAKPAHRDRILPYQRCLIAFQVRRDAKERRGYSLRDFFKILEEEGLDKLTFLYIRNGEQLYRLSTGIEFDEKLFPDLDREQLAGRLWADVWSDGHVQHLYTEGEYEALRQLEAKEDEEYRKRGWGSSHHRSEQLHEFTPDDVYYDDIARHIAGEMEKHNRLVLVLQGLLDRSPVLQPHPSWQLWTAEGFGQALDLIYDLSRGLTAGPPPDFEAYRSRINASLAAGSITVGQEEAWERREAEKANAIRDRNWRDKGNYRPERVRPPGDPGPGTLAHVLSVRGRDRRCRFEWERERRTSTWSHWRWQEAQEKGPVRSTIEVPASKLLNVSAYTPGDFHLFFDDPRTRADYLRWAPLLLEAEEYWAGNRTVGPKEG